MNKKFLVNIPFAHFSTVRTVTTVTDNRQQISSTPSGLWPRPPRRGTVLTANSQGLCKPNAESSLLELC